MSNESIETLTQAVTDARSKADELKAALTDASTDQDRADAAAAEEAAVEAEKALAGAKAAAEAAQGGGGADNGSEGPKGGDTPLSGAPDADASRTGFVSKGAPGEECICPDGRKGTIHKFDDTGLICIPNWEQA